MHEKSITRIVITGGPCAGKTTCMSYLRQKLNELGYGVIVVPESATELMTSGCVPAGNISLYDFQEVILEVQLRKEDAYLLAAKKMTQEKVVILLDRGVMDNKAYIEDHEWDNLLEDSDHSLVSLRDKRYDAVVHLRTAALGAEKFFGNDTNVTRKETVEEARVLDQKTLDVWIGHAHLHGVNNEYGKDFDHKIRNAYRAVLHVLGEPIPLEIERKYLIAHDFDFRSIPSKYQEIGIEQAYLPQGYRIRKRGQHGVYMYTKTYKKDTEDPFVRVETEEIISARTYRELMTIREKDITILNKKRMCFVYMEQYFELDIFDGEVSAYGKPLIMLEIELTDAQKEVILPPWLPIVKEVTDDLSYRNVEIAKKMKE